MYHLSSTLRLGLVFISVATLTWALHKRKRWFPVGRLKNIYIYPVKSGQWKELSEAECTPLGLKYSSGDKLPSLRDRVFVVFDEVRKNFISGKLNPKLIFVSVRPSTETSVVFSHPDKEDIEVQLPDHFDDSLVTLWASEKIRSVDCGDEISRWISEVVKGESRGLRVGYWPESEEIWRRDVESLRPLEMTVFKNLSNKFTGAYSDLSSYLLINNNSVEELNGRIEEGDRCKVLNFRPNLVVDGPEAFSEDGWDWLRIGGVVFRVFRPCTRCSFTTVNPDTGEKNKAAEPIKTLKTYRTMEQLGEPRVDAPYPAMGVYIGLHKGGTIRPGDQVYIYK